MNAPMHSIPGQVAAQAVVSGAPADNSLAAARTVAEVLAHSHVEPVLQELEDSLVGLAPVKARIRDIAALLVIDKLRLNLGLAAQAPPRRTTEKPAGIFSTRVPRRVAMSSRAATATGPPEAGRGAKAGA